MSEGARIAIDIGGTFTDVVLEAGDRLFTSKVLTTPAAPDDAVIPGTRDVLRASGVGPGDVALVIHGTTLATNAIIERKGSVTAFLTTGGFRDVLEIGRFRSPRLYDLDFRKPEPLVERRLRLEVPERMLASGSVFKPLDEAACVMVGRRCVELGVDAIAVCFTRRFKPPEAPNKDRLVSRIGSNSWPNTTSCW